MKTEAEDRNLKELQDAYALLRESNEKLYNSMKAFQIAAQESGSLVFTYDTEKQAIFVDEKTAKAFHVETVQTGVPYEMVKRGIVSPDSQSEYLRIHEAMINGAKEAGGIVKLIPNAGEEIIYELNFRAILSEEGTPTGTAVGIYRDITSRYIKELEQERYQQIVYSSDRFTFQYEADSDTLIIFSSPVISSREGGDQYYFEQYSQILAEGKLCPDADIPILEDLFQNGAKKPVQIQLYSAKSGELRWYALTASVVKQNGQVKRVFGTISDITDIKSRESSYRKLERVLRGMKDEYLGIFEVDLQNDQFATLSYGEEAMLKNIPSQGSYSEFMKRLKDEMVAPEYKSLFSDFSSIEHLRQALSNEKRIEIEYKTMGNGYAWRRTLYQAVEYNGKTPVKVVMYQVDIDQIKAEKLMQQQAMEEAYNYAEAANAAKTDFLSRMSHDIRTPMNAIIGMTAIASTQIENKERVQECLDKITIASKHLLSLINEVLDMSKIESGKMELQEEEFNLTELIDNMITMILPQINQHNHNLQVSVEDLKHEWVIGDSLRIQQAFVNLITNAVKYTPDGGMIKVHIQERAIKVPDYGEYEFIFEDNGIGMTEDFQKVIFEPFTRAEDSRVSKVAGTGLGMAITRNMIRMMDGDIQVASKVNQGSKFTVTIHLKLQDKCRETPEELKGLPVLVVDDDLATCESACIMLEDIGMKAEWSLTGQEAIHKITARSQKDSDYFAVILDWKMPDMDGVTTAKAIRKQVGEKVPVIIITAYDWSDIEAEARAVGIDHFIAKPLFKSRFVRVFRNLLYEENTAADKQIISEKPIFKGKRILLVEDNELNAEIAQEILQMTGVLVDRASDGRQAVNQIQDSDEGTYDMVFMDIQMPFLNGYQATAAIRNLDRRDVKTLPIVAMTANAFAEDVNQAKNAGMNEHISKPIDLGQLEFVMTKYLSGHC